MLDISFLVPLAQVYDVTTDVLLGVGTETYDLAYIQQVKEKVQEIEKSKNEKAENLLEAYKYLKSCVDRNPSNYTLSVMCIEKGASLSMHTDFYNFMSDRGKEKAKIFEECARLASCIIRYSVNQTQIEKAHNAMIWIYLHEKEYDKAREHCNALPSYDANRMKEPMLAQVLWFEKGYEAEKECIIQNMRKLSAIICKEFCYDMQDIAGNDTLENAKEYAEWMKSIASVFMQKEEYADLWKECIEKIEFYVNSRDDI